MPGSDATARRRSPTTDAPAHGWTLDGAELARALRTVSGVEDAWETVVRLAVERLPGVGHAGITVVVRGEPTTPAASDELPRAVDRLQYALGQGPCLDAIREEQTFRSRDLSQESTRWSDFGPRVAQELGLHSMLSLRLFVADETLGALNFYSRQVDAFPDAAVDAGTTFAALAALALANARDHDLVSHLRQALESNRRIGVAIGVLMALQRVTDEQAFALLRENSQRRNRKLKEVADHVVETGQLPGA